MSKLVAIIDYKMGNICSVEKALASIGANYLLTANPTDIKNASHILIPGVGHFGKGMQELSNLDLINLIKEQSKLKPILGICLGMQVLFNSSEEASKVPGLSLINGDLKLFKIALKVPHVGWNNVYSKSSPDLFKDIENGSNFYFVHSFYLKLNEAIKHTLTDYEIEFVSAVQKDNIFGAQFHPEKSQKVGLKFLQNFINYA